MDIECLLALQNLRFGALEWLTWPMNIITLLGTGVPFVAVAIIVFWLKDKFFGVITVCSYSMGMFFGQFLKLVCCVYRPWVRDVRVIPDAQALGGATGYSFPSCHAAGITASLGAIAYRIRKHKGWCATAIVLIVLVCFSRNFLGVHTPQDILVGAALGLAAIFCSRAFVRWVHRKPSHDVIMIIGVYVIGIASLVFFLSKSYPMDYLDGVLLVDPAIMVKDAIEATGATMGFFTGWFIERHFVRYEPVGISKRSIALTVVGLAIAGAIMLALPLALKPLFGTYVSGFAKYFLLFVFAFSIWPAVLQRCCAKAQSGVQSE